MAFAGRKRSDKARTASGQLSRALQDNRLVAQMQRVRPDILRALGRPELGTPVGRLFMLGEILSAQFAAAQKVADLASAYEWATDAPRRHPAGMDFNRVAGRLNLDDSNTEVAERKVATIAAFSAAKTACSRAEWLAVDQIVLGVSEPLSYEMRRDLKKALTALAIHWRLQA